MKVEELVREYLPHVNIMQLATSINNQPWLCTVHYYSDEDLNLYWRSDLGRRHSKEIEHNQQVAAYVLVHENTPDEDYVIGISIIGKAELIGKNVEEEVCKGYIAKLNKNAALLEDTASDKDPHKFYKLKPEQIVLFDTKNFPDKPRQEWALS